MAAALLPRELASWSLIAVALGALEGGLLGVIVKNRFDGLAPDAWVNLAVAMVAGAPAFANLVSVAVAGWAMGREKIRRLSALMAALGASLILLALPPATAGGLLAFTMLAVLARMCWSGILTLRAAVWRANYAREWRGRVTGRMAQLASLIMAATGAGIGLALDWRADAYRWLFALAGVAALAAAHRYARSRLRRQRQLLDAEQADRQAAGAPRPRRLLAILSADRDFRRYMAGMMLFGSGNLMVIAMLVVIFNEQFAMARTQQVLLTSSVPLLMIALTIPLWARFLDRRHIIDYRALHSWFFVAAFAVFALGTLLGQAAWFWPAAALLGMAYAGGELGWNLGHNDFASDAHSSLYMAIHVSLTGLRGGVMPLVGVAFYEALERAAPGAGRWALLLPLALSTAGAAWFVALSRARR